MPDSFTTALTVISTARLFLINLAIDSASLISLI